MFFWTFGASYFCKKSKHNLAFLCNLENESICGHHSTLSHGSQVKFLFSSPEYNHLVFKTIHLITWILGCPTILGSRTWYRRNRLGFPLFLVMFQNFSNLFIKFIRVTLVRNILGFRAWRFHEWRSEDCSLLTKTYPFLFFLACSQLSSHFSTLLWSLFWVPGNRTWLKDMCITSISGP